MSIKSQAGRPGAVGFRTVGLGALGVLALASVAGWFGYTQMIHYERRAQQHIPRTAQWAVHVDVESVIVYEPVRRHLMQLLGTGAGAGGQRLRRLREQADLNVARDLREVLVAGTEKHWLIALGGLFHDRPLVDLIAQQVLTEEHRLDWERRGEQLIRVRPPRLAMGQSVDGLWLIADSEDFLSEALIGSQRSAELGLLINKDATWGAIHSPQPDESGLWGLPGMAGTQQLFGSLSAKQEFQLSLTLRGTDNSPMAEQLRHWQPPGGALWESWLPTVEWGGERSVLLRLKASQREDELQLRSSWTRTEADRAANSLAAWAQRWGRTMWTVPETF